METLKKRELIEDPETGDVLVPLTKGGVARIDSVDSGWVSEHNWILAVSCGGYAARGTHYLDSEGCRRSLFLLLHRQVVEHSGAVILAGQEVDHRNGIRLDCRRSNLRICTREGNMRNRLARRDKIKGVSRKGNKYQAAIRANGRQIYLGLFDTLEEAKAAYNAAALKYHGEFARLNP